MVKQNSPANLPTTSRAETWHTGEKVELEKALRIILLISTAGSLAIAAVSLGSGWFRTFWITLVLGGISCFCNLIGRSGRWRTATATLLLALVCVLCYEAAGGNGLHDLGILVVPAILVIAALVFDWLAYVLFVGAAVTAVSVVAAWSWTHHGLDKFTDKPVTEYIVLLVILFFAALTGRLVARQLFQSWERTREIADKYQSIFHNIQDVYYEMQPDGTVLEMSPNGEQLLQTKRDAMIGSSLLPFYQNQSVHDTFLARLREHRHLSNYELRLKDPGGHSHTVLVSAALSGEPGEAGEKVIGSIRDITERRQLEEHLAQAQKMESIGTLAGGIAHDFNNLLTVINGNCEMARIKMEAGENSAEDLVAIQKAGMRATELTRKLLAFSRKQSYRAIPVDVDSLLLHLEAIIKTLIGEDIRIEKRIAPDIPRILADPSQLEQVLINLLVNARDAINEKSTRASDKCIRICAMAAEVSQDKVAGGVPKRHLELAISDNGIGMSAEVKNRLFEPFFTTKKTGTGLGLATVYGIVRQNNGFVEVEGELHQGTTIRIYWPATETQADEVLKQDESLMRGSEGILVVEDEIAVREFVCRALVSCGYKVSEARDGKEALCLLKEQAHLVQLVITDVVMPEMDGKELIQKVREIIPQPKVLFMSGYAEERISHGGAIETGINFIQKPFSRIELSRKVREILDTRPNAMDINHAASRILENH
jgi:two-component system, cell cycle sensor histidine kinase and response regulator CckA